MSAIDPKHFRKASEIAQTILNSAIAGDESIKETPTTVGGLLLAYTDPETAPDLDTGGIKELLSNLQAIAEARTGTLAMGGNEAKKLLESINADCIATAEDEKSGINPVAKAEKGDEMAGLETLLRAARGHRGDPDKNETSDAAATAEYYYWKRRADAIDKVVPMIDKLAAALERERGQGPKR